MDVIKIIPALWKLLEKKKCAINISNIDNELSVSIIRKGRVKRFVNESTELLLLDIKNYLHV